MTEINAPYHAHVYYSSEERTAAQALRENFLRDGDILFVGRLMDRPVGPHPIAQFEAHFGAGSVPKVVATIEASGLRALVHPLTDDDLADHTTHGRWIGKRLELDTSVLDPPGINQGIARFGKSDSEAGEC
jgi:aromatic ring-cleaving dioxygenase